MARSDEKVEVIHVKLKKQNDLVYRLSRAAVREELRRRPGRTAAEIHGGLAPRIGIVLEGNRELEGLFPLFRRQGALGSSESRWTLRRLSARHLELSFRRR